MVHNNDMLQLSCRTEAGNGDLVDEVLISFSTRLEKLELPHTQSTSLSEFS